MTGAAGTDFPAAVFCLATVVIPGRARFGANPESRSIVRLTSRFRVCRHRGAHCAARSRRPGMTTCLICLAAEHLVELATRKTVAEFGEGALLRDLARGFHETRPGGPRRRAADADAAHAEVRGLRDAQAGRADQQVERFGLHRLDHFGDVL